MWQPIIKAADTGWPRCRRHAGCLQVRMVAAAGQGRSDVDASTDGGITTVTDHIWEEKQRHGVIFVRGLLLGGRSDGLTHTSTVGRSLCSPLTAALRPVCPESQDWTSYHT